MSELQAEEASYEDAEVEQPIEAVDNVDEVSELAPEKKKIEFSEEQQAVLDDLAAKKTYKIREAERQVEQYKRELDEMRAKLPQETRPDVPKVPDPYDDDYEAKIQARDAALLKRAEFDTKRTWVDQQTAQNQQQAAYQAQQAKQETVTKFVGQAKKLGVTTEELNGAAKVIDDFGIGDTVVQFILSNDQGPLIAKYLGNNPLELDTLRRLDPMSAAIRIENVIKSKAAALGKRTPTAPDPTDTLRGNGAAPKARGPAGATFE
jgi:hypothetical protein